MTSAIALQQIREICQPKASGRFILGFPFNMVDGVGGQVEQARPQADMVAVDKADHARPIHQHVAGMAIAVN